MAQNSSNSKSNDLDERGSFGFFLGSIGLVLPVVAGGVTSGSGWCNERLRVVLPEVAGCG